MSDFLVANLGFFFVPPGVALMLYFDVIASEFWPIVTASIISTLLVIVVSRMGFSNMMPVFFCRSLARKKIPKVTANRKNSFSKKFI